MKRMWRAVKCVLIVIAAMYLFLCVSLRVVEREAGEFAGDCVLYYAVNCDGMKGLGHSILLLVDAEGGGLVLSFNGMQRTLEQALAGKAGVGKMSVGRMSKEETALFLKTGNLNLNEDQLQDNYDVAIYRRITAEEYDAIWDAAAVYIKTGEEYGEWYSRYIQADSPESREAYQREMERMGEDDSLPLYRLYTHNCDHAARLLAAAVDSDMSDYNQGMHPITPNGNLKAFAARNKRWGAVRLGEMTLPEKILEFFVIF